MNTPDTPALNQKSIAEHEQRIRELEQRADIQGEIIEELKTLLDRCATLLPGGVR